MTAAAAPQGASALPPSTRIGYMGPHGTFTEAALAGAADLSQCTPVSFISVPEVLSALDDATVDYGFVPVENAIEGAVNVTQDALAFDFDFLIRAGRIVVDMARYVGDPPPPSRILADRLVGIEEAQRRLAVG